MRRGSFAFAPRFSANALLLVDFTRVRIRLVKPGTNPEQIALDTTIDFPSNADSIRLALTVPLASGATSEDFDLTLAMINAAGDTVFRGGPTRVSATVGTGSEAPDVPIVYVGVGSTATGVRFVTAPTMVFFGDTAVFTAEAFDAGGQVIPGTPILFEVDPQDTTRAKVPDPTVGRVVAKPVRGTARVIAALLTNQTATSTLKVQPLPVAIAIMGGSAQTQMAGTVLAQPLTVRVKAADSLGVEGVSVAFSVTSGGGSLSQSVVTTDANGDASVVWTLGITAGSQTVTATAGSLTTAPIGATATPAAGVPATIAINAGNGQSVGAGTAVPVPPSVVVRDGLSALLSGATVTFAVASGGGSVTGASATTNASGIATVGSWTLGATPGANTLTATVSGLTPVTFGATGLANFITLQSGVTVRAGQTTSLGITLSIAAPTGGLAVTLTSSDTSKLKVTTPTVNIAAGQTTGSATLQGVAAGSVAVNATASGYTAGATTVSVTGVPAVLTLVSGGNQTASPSTLLPQPVVVLVTDVLGNPVAGFPVTFAVASGGGSVGTGSTTTNASGQASTTWTLGAAVGTQTITVTASGLAGSPLTVAANAPVIASTTVSPQRDTLKSIRSTRALVAQAKDGTGANLTGSFTWVSRTPAVATVGVTGVVTALTNGSTYVVATEAGGTKDSALIVVQQTLATINVAPGTRSIYLTRNFTFIASAADGGGTPLPTQPTFTWTTTAPAVATVNSSGLVTAVGLGSAQIRATSGTVIGVANVAVITPITRIAVVVDTALAFKTDTFTLTSLGLPRHYRAIAHDTLDAVMAGVSFTWVSTNGSVAVLSQPAGDTTTATSAANGLTQILATAQGFTSAPGAQLTVQQVLASIALAAPASNPTATIAVTGTVGLVARGKDANSRFISGGSFTFASATPGVAAVDAVTGVVTGVANGTAGITASSGAITSNALTVTVGGAVPAIISFGRDTVAVGRGSSASIPILLSKPAASPLIVKLSVADTFAYWSTLTVTIPAGQTSVNAQLNGRNAGTTTVTATDSSGLGYSAASAVAKVTANSFLTTTYYYVNATDIVRTQVLLSDPSPAGGTYITFSYSTPGIAAISPDPAFIPAGQLAADIQIRGLAAGTTNITPSAIGVNGTASYFQAYPPVLTVSPSLMVLGQGQYDDPYVYYYYCYYGACVSVPYYVTVPVPVTLTNSDTSVVTVPSTVTIPTGYLATGFRTSTKATGTATITASSPGWTSSGSITVVSTTPRLGMSGGGQLNTTSPYTNVTIYAEDSLRTVHYRTNSLVIPVRSTDTTVMRVLDTLVTIGPAQQSVSARVIPGGNAGTAYIVATASGHGPDSTLYTVVGPNLYFGWYQRYIGAGQYDYDTYYCYYYGGTCIYTQDPVAAPLVVTVANSNPTSVTVPAVDTIPASSNQAAFSVVANAVGSATLIASAPGYQPDTASYTVTSPRLTACCNYTFNNFSPGYNLTVYSTDSLRSGHNRSTPLVVSVVSDNPRVATVDSSAVTIAAGQYYNNSAHLTPLDTGTAHIVFTASGHLTLDTLTITVTTPALYFNYYSYTIGRRQHSGSTDLSVQTPDYRPSPLAVTITQKRGTVDTLTATALTIPTSSYYTYFGIYGLTNGNDTLIASAPGYLPATAFVTVTTPQLTYNYMPPTATVGDRPISTYIYAADSLQPYYYYGHLASDTVVVAAVSSDSNVIRPAQPFFRILKDANYALDSVYVVGPGTASITYSDSAGTGYRPTTTSTITVTGPSLTLGNNTPVIGMRQRSFYQSYVYTPNSVATPLVVSLISTDPRVATVPASVTIPAQSNIVYFDVTGQDTLGTIQIQASATGYNAAAMNVRVTQPQFLVYYNTQVNTTSGPQTIYVQAADANGNAHYTTENVTVTLVSSSPSVASIDSTTVTIVSGAYQSAAAKWTPGIVGTARLTASDQRAVLYKYNDGFVDVTVVMPTLYLGSGPGVLGIGQYQDYVYVQAPDAQASNLAVTFTHTGAARTGTFTNLTNTAITGLTIPQGQSYTYFRMAGVARGTDSLTASATSPAHNPVTIYTVVDSGRVDPINGWPGTIKAGDSVQVTLVTRDPNAVYQRSVLNAETFTLTPNSNIEFRSGGAVITSVTVPADQQSVTFYLKGVSTGTGSATITSANYKTHTNTVPVTP